MDLRYISVQNCYYYGVGENPLTWYSCLVKWIFTININKMLEGHKQI